MRYAVAGLGAVLLLGLAALVGHARATPPDGVVVLELFTSQGCSSCPPADALLARLGRENFDGKVIPLAWHVDYWNHLGWRDPFSSADASARQRAYARALRAQVYTPQLVVNGTSQYVGSAEAFIRGEMRRQLAIAPRAKVTIDGVTLSAGKVTAEAHATLEPALSSRRMTLVVVLFEESESTAVSAGENGGSRLTNPFIVRRVANVDPRGGSAELKSDPAWGRLGVAAFLQDRDSLAIYGAASRLGIGPRNAMQSPRGDTEEAKSALVAGRR